jgi:dipeptidyl aminopeptidase/acylaminoacyl peptidase
MAIADFAAKLPWVDSDRMGVTGGSYGGYMTNWITGHTNRFKAAVSCRSTCNRFSQFGTSDAAYMNGEFEFDGDPWDNPEAYLSRSPIMYVRNVETPLLLIHSEGDLRCPISQAYEMFVALKKLKKTVAMVSFPGEDHNLSRTGKPLYRVERLEYIVAWFDTYMGPGDDDYSVSLAKPAKVVLKLPEKPVPGEGEAGNEEEVR